jgi:hypothetical protein
MTVCHLTTVHNRGDPRIFGKECRSLAEAGYSVSLVVADGGKDETVSSVRIYGVRNRSDRLKRILFSPSDAFKRALELDAELYHLHDPELIPIGLRLKRAAKVVIFDSHEDVPLQLMRKGYVPGFLKAIATLSLDSTNGWHSGNSMRSLFLLPNSLIK